MSGYRIATFIAGLLLAAVAAQSIGAFGGSSPRITAPCSLPLVAPIFMGVPIYLVLAAPPLIFWMWASTLFGGNPVASRKTSLLLSALGLLSIGWYLAGWDYGLRFEGAEYVYTTSALSGLCFATSLLLLGWSRRSPSFSVSLAVHWLLFAWAITFAFPYLGEA